MNIHFGTDVAQRDDVERWSKELQEALPEGSTVVVKPHPLILDVSEVTDEHAGNFVTIRGYYKPAVQTVKADERAKGNFVTILEQRNLSGTLEQVYQSGSSEFRRTFVIDGKAYDIPAYSLVELVEW